MRGVFCIVLFLKSLGSFIELIGTTILFKIDQGISKIKAHFL